MVTGNFPTPTNEAGTQSWPGKEAGTRPVGVAVVYERYPAIVRRSLAIDAKDIYWLETSLKEGNQVAAGPKSGAGPVRLLGTWYDFGSAHSLSLDAEHVYWLRDDEGGVVVKVAKQGGTEQLLEVPRRGELRSSLRCIEVLDEHVWIATAGCAEIIRMNKDGSDGQVWVVDPWKNAGATTGIALHTDKLYCGNGANVYEVDPNSTQPEKVIGDLKYAGALTSAQGRLYFVNNAAVAGNDERLLSWNAGDPSPTDHGPAFGFVSRLSYDSARAALYWVREGRFQGALAQYPLDGKPVLKLEEQEVMGPANQDEGDMYWPGDTVIYRAKK